jgi:hypothetical protein
LHQPDLPRADVEGVTLVLPSRLSCLTNIRENISYKLEYQLCETRSIRTSTSITLKKQKDKLSPPLRAQKVTWRTPAIYLYVSMRKRVMSTPYSHSQLSPAFAKPRLPWKFWKSAKAKVSLCRPLRPMLPFKHPAGCCPTGMALNKHSLAKVPCANSLRHKNKWLPWTELSW